MASLIQPEIGAKHIVELQPATCRIVSLPVEMLLEIIDYLKPCDKFLLSHTCQILRQLTTRDWVYWRQAARKEDVYEFCFGIAYHHADCWACAKGNLHHVTYQGDTPEGPVEECLCWQLNTIGFAQIHVQLAVKYTRLEQGLNSRQRSHLRSMLAPCGKEDKDYNGVKLSFHVKPRVADGMFIVEDEYRFYNLPENGRVASFSPDILFDFNFPVCPHLTVLNQGDDTKMSSCFKIMHHSCVDGPLWTFDETLERPLPPKWESPSLASCSRCATDLAFHTYRNKKNELVLLSLRMWTALGSDRFEDIYHWRGQLDDLGEYRGAFEPGGVKRQWMESGGKDEVLVMPDAQSDTEDWPHPNHWGRVEVSPMDYSAVLTEEVLRAHDCGGPSSTVTTSDLDSLALTAE